MAIVSRCSGNWVFSLKVLLLSSGVLSMAVILKLSVPVILDFLVSEVPLLWSFLRSCLTPPYLYVIINGIIITIAASSRFHHKADEHPEPVVPVKAGYDSVVVKNPVDVPAVFGYDVVPMINPLLTPPDFEGLETAPVYGGGDVRVSEVKNPVSGLEEEGEDDGFVISRSAWTPQRRDLPEIPSEHVFEKEKPLVSVRFGHRRMFKASPEAGRALGVAKPKRNDTLETTWKTITEGRPIPLARHLKKSDTWEIHGRHVNAGSREASPMMQMKKSETFTDRKGHPPSSLSPSPGSGKLRKEPSLSQDELNRRVEAFIKKFNEDMRLQRQESLNRYKEMVNRGTH